MPAVHIRLPFLSSILEKFSGLLFDEIMLTVENIGPAGGPELDRG